MEFMTEDKMLPLENGIIYGDRIFFLGSCFADEIGGICRGLGFDATLNPFGTLFNPSSIRDAIMRLNEGRHFTENDVVKVDEGYYSTFSHNNRFWYNTPEKLLSEANTALDKAIQHYNQTQWVIISLGTAWCYRLAATGNIVSNCHKMPASDFQRLRLSVDESAAILSEIVSHNADKRFIFTVSPLRHLSDGLHGNQLSKATLLLAIDKVCGVFKNANYFGAYEILLDELRDYRFYKEDMFHPSDQTVRYIWDKFKEYAFDESCRKPIEMAERLRQMLYHKPFYPVSKAYKSFLETIDKLKEELKANYPKMKLENIL